MSGDGTAECVIKFNRPLDHIKDIQIVPSQADLGFPRDNSCPPEDVSVFAALEAECFHHILRMTDDDYPVWGTSHYAASCH